MPWRFHSSKWLRGTHSVVSLTIVMRPLLSWTQARITPPGGRLPRRMGTLLNSATNVTIATRR
jgi:hypothetical protein